MECIELYGALVLHLGWESIGMDKVIEYLLIIMVGSAEWYALAEVAYIVGLFGIFKKSGIKPA